MAKLCPLMILSTHDERRVPRFMAEPQECRKEDCAWWVEVEEDDDGGLCSVLVLALNSGVEAHSH